MNSNTMHDTQHSDGGWSLAFVLTSIFLKVASNVTPNTITDVLTIIMLCLAIAYHIMGVTERWDKFFVRMMKLYQRVQNIKNKFTPKK